MMTKRTAKRKAEANGHLIGRFQTRTFTPDFGRTQTKLYDVAHCQRCEAALFANENKESAKSSNPALERRCGTD